MKQLKLPPYEWLKALPLKRTVTYTDRETGESWDDEEHCQYDFMVFNTPAYVHGQISYNEDDTGHIFFDVFEQGHTGMNRYGMALKFNKTNYKKICKHAQEVYEMFYRELDKDMSWQWECSPEEYFANEF
jgi:hypothetical protein